MRRNHQMYLRRRDLAILRSLAEARYLSIQAIEWLFWPAWWARWQACHERRQAGARGHRASYRVADGVYQRLRRLTEARLIVPVERPFVLAAEYRSRDPTVYELAPDGLRLLAACDVLPLPMAKASLVPPADPIAQLRQIEVGRIYAALRATVETHGGKLRAWRAAHSLQPHAAIDVAAGTTGRGQIQRIAIDPDATGQIQRLGREPHRYFIEVARSMAAETWQATVLAYESYLDSPRSRVRYGQMAASVLVFATDERHRQRLLAATAQVIGASDRYLFGLVSQIHPTTIAHDWCKLTPVAEQGQAERDDGYRGLLTSFHCPASARRWGRYHEEHRHEDDRMDIQAAIGPLWSHEIGSTRKRRSG